MDELRVQSTEPGQKPGGLELPWYHSIEKSAGTRSVALNPPTNDVVNFSDCTVYSHMTS